MALAETDAADEESLAQWGVVKIFASKVDRRGRYKGTSHGSGFLLNDNGYVATNHHVIDGDPVLLVAADGDTVDANQLLQSNASLIWADKDLDLAVVRVTPPLDARPALLSNVLPKKGGAVFAVGFPGGAEERDVQSDSLRVDSTVTAGVLSRAGPGTWSDGRRPIRQIQHSADVSWGNSGGPLKDECGRVIGVNTEISIKTLNKNSATVVPGLNFASHASELISILDSLAIDYDVSSVACTSAIARADEDLDELRGAIRWLLIAVAGAFVVVAGLAVAVVARSQPAVRASATGPTSPAAAIADGRQVAAPRLSAKRSERNGHSREGAYSERSRGGTAGGYQIVARGGTSGISFALDEKRPSILLGRPGGDAQQVVDEPSVSRRHCQFRFEAGELFVKDLGSTNGTRINGADVGAGEERRLSRGDRLTIGKVVLQVV